MGKHNSRAGYLVANREEAPNTDKNKYIIQYALYAIIFYILETYAAKKNSSKCDETLNEQQKNINQNRVESYQNAAVNIRYQRMYRSNIINIDRVLCWHRTSND